MFVMLLSTVSLFAKVRLVHHIKLLAEGGTHDESNLQILCISCREKIYQRKKPS